MRFLEIISSETLWSLATLLLVALCNVLPTYACQRIRSSQTSKLRSADEVGQAKREAQSRPQKLPPRNEESEKTLRVSFHSMNQNPSADTTEVSETTEGAEVEHKIVEQSSPNAPALPPATAFSGQSNPIQIVGASSVGLANIPECPLPALRSSLKLKQKLLRQDPQNQIGGSSAFSLSTMSTHPNQSQTTSSTTRRRHHSRSATAASLPKIPPRGSARRHRSEGLPSSHKDTLRQDTIVLQRLSKAQMLHHG